MEKKRVKALSLLSGGLDSILAARLLLEQGIEVLAVNFRTNFCDPSKARPAAKLLGIPLREVNIREEFLPVLKNPKHGYGTAMNPCIDCHALMLKKAGEIMREENFDVIATGEVLNQRPMSQHKQSLKTVEKDAGIEGYLLRPLSAKFLEPTIPEQDGRVDREKLLAISGRSRKEQMALAAKYGIKNYPSPAGGCALTQEGFAERLKELMKHKPDFTPEDVDLVSIGRHFFYPELVEGGGAVQIIIGRNQEENEILQNIAGKNDCLVEPDFPGPSALIKNSRNKKHIEKAKETIIQFSPKAQNIKDLNFKIK